MNRLLLIVALVAQTGCTTWNYRIEGENVVFGIRSWNHDPLNYVISGADAASFRPIKDGYAKDRSHVYLKGEVIPDADPATFTILSGGYAKDVHRVFLSRCSLPGADPDTWRFIAEFWSRDATFVFQGHCVVPGANPDTFRYIKDSWAIDGKRAYHHLAFYPDDCSGFGPFNRLSVFEDIDPTTFLVIDAFRAKDSRREYDALNIANQSTQQPPIIQQNTINFESRQNPPSERPPKE